MGTKRLLLAAAVAASYAYAASAASDDLLIPWKSATWPIRANGKFSVGSQLYVDSIAQRRLRWVTTWTLSGDRGAAEHKRHFQEYNFQQVLAQHLWTANFPNSGRSEVFIFIPSNGEYQLEEMFSSATIDVRNYRFKLDWTDYTTGYARGYEFDSVQRPTILSTEQPCNFDLWYQPTGVDNVINLRGCWSLCWVRGTPHGATAQVRYKVGAGGTYVATNSAAYETSAYFNANNVTLPGSGPWTIYAEVQTNNGYRVWEYVLNDRDFALLPEYTGEDSPDAPPPDDDDPPSGGGNTGDDYTPGAGEKTDLKNALNDLKTRGPFGDITAGTGAAGSWPRLWTWSPPNPSAAYLGGAEVSSVQPLPGLAPDQPIGSRPLDWPSNPGPVQGASGWATMGSAITSLRTLAGSLVLAAGLIACIVWLKGHWTW